MSEVQAVSMESESMSALRADMNAIINKTIKTMQMGNNGEATVSVKIKIGLEKRTVPHEKSVRTAIVPTFEHDVQSVVQTKDKKSGSLAGEYELVYDPDHDTWYMRDIRSQISMFDEDVQREAAGRQVVDAEPVDPVGLPEPALCLGSGEVIEAEGDVDEEMPFADLESDSDDEKTDSGLLEEDE